MARRIAAIHDQLRNAHSHLFEFLIQIKAHLAARAPHKLRNEDGHAMGDAFLIWQETFAVGHPGLDREHRRLVELINDIAGLSAEGAGPENLSSRCGALYFASVEHFRHENSVMRDIIDGAYMFVDDQVRQRGAMSESAINDHCAEHARALIKLESMIHQIHSEGSHAALLASELKVWFLDHAINHDAHLRDVFQTRRNQLSSGTDSGLQQAPADLNRSMR